MNNVIRFQSNHREEVTARLSTSGPRILQAQPTRVLEALKLEMMNCM